MVRSEILVWSAKSAGTDVDFEVFLRSSDRGTWVTKKQTSN